MSVFLPGTTTIDQSQNSLANISLLSNVVVTRDANTPPGDPVIVNFSTLATVGALASITVQNGATAIVGQGLIGVNALTTINVDGGILEVGGSLLTANALNNVNVGPSGGVIKIDPTGLSAGVLNVPVTFTGGSIPKGFYIDFPPNPPALPGFPTSPPTIYAEYNPLTNVTTIGDGINLLGILGVGRTITLNGNPLGVGLLPSVVGVSDGHGGIAVYPGGVPCFLPGTLIETPEGEVAVERLSVGGEVIAVVNGERVARRIAWIGNRMLDGATDHGERLHPVLIRAGALEDGVPHSDLRVTPEHCMFIAGKLIPARMLVNGRSIVVERETSRFEVFHVETDDHSVIVANGALSESYLDTGNRRAFRQPGNVVGLPLGAAQGATRSWATDAAAPLCVDRAVVEPIWKTLDARADALGLDPRPAAPALTQDPDLRLVAPNGREIRPLYTKDGRAVFSVPGTLDAVRIVSRTARPSETVGPFLDDRRTLGVLVGEVAVWTETGRVARDAHLTEAVLAGWDVQEAGPHRWTNGAALLPLGLDGAALSVMLEIEIVAAGPYVADQHVAAAADRAEVRAA